MPLVPTDGERTRTARPLVVSGRLTVALAACLVPVLRAARVDPVVALRAD